MTRVVHAINTHSRFTVLAPLLLILLFLAACNSVGSVPGGEVDIAPSYVGNYKAIPSYNYTKAKAKISSVVVKPGGNTVNGLITFSHFSNNCVYFQGRVGTRGAFTNLARACGQFRNQTIRWKATRTYSNSFQLRLCDYYYCGRNVTLYTNKR